MSAALPPPQLPIPPADLEHIREVVKRAEAGDVTTLPELRRLLDQPRTAAVFTRLAVRIRGALLKMLAADNLGCRPEEMIVFEDSPSGVSAAAASGARVIVVKAATGGVDHDPPEWITNEKSCWKAHDRLVELRHYPLINRRQERLLTKRDAFERRAGKLVEYPSPVKPR